MQQINILKLDVRKYLNLQCLRDDEDDKSGRKANDDNAAHYQLQQQPTIKLEINLKHKF